jgi:YD repeat-containing protein
VTYPSGRTVTYARDSLGRISGVTTKKDASSATVTLASSVAHQPFGPLAGLTYGNGLTLTRTFTQDYLIDTLSVMDGATAVIQRGFARGDDINLTGIAEGAVSGRDETDVYTAANRLQEGDGPWGTLRICLARRPAAGGGGRRRHGDAEAVVRAQSFLKTGIQDDGL